MEKTLCFLLLVFSYVHGDTRLKLVVSAPYATVNSSFVLNCTYEGNEPVVEFRWMFEEKGTFEIVTVDGCLPYGLSLSQKFQHSFTCPNKKTSSLIFERMTTVLQGKTVSCRADTENDIVRSNTVRLHVLGGTLPSATIPQNVKIKTEYHTTVTEDITSPFVKTSVLSEEITKTEEMSTSDYNTTSPKNKLAFTHGTDTSTEDMTETITTDQALSMITGSPYKFGEHSPTKNTQTFKISGLDTEPTYSTGEISSTVEDTTKIINTQFETDENKFTSTSPMPSATDITVTDDIDTSKTKIDFNSALSNVLPTTAMYTETDITSRNEENTPSPYTSSEVTTQNFIDPNRNTETAITMLLYKQSSRISESVSTEEVTTPKQTDFSTTTNGNTTDKPPENITTIKADIENTTIYSRKATQSTHGSERETSKTDAISPIIEFSTTTNEIVTSNEMSFSKDSATSAIEKLSGSTTEASSFYDARTSMTDSSFIDTESVPTSEAGGFNLETTDISLPQFITGQSAISTKTLNIISESNSASKVTEVHPATEHNTTTDSRSQTSQTSDFDVLSVSTKYASSSSHVVSESKSATPVSDSSSQSLYIKSLVMTTVIDSGNTVTTSELNYHTTSEYDNTFDVPTSEKIDTQSNSLTTTDESTNSGYSKATDNKISSDSSMIVTESQATVTNYSHVHAIKTESLTPQSLNISSEVDTTTNSIQFSSNIEGKSYATRTDILSTLVKGITKQTTESEVDHVSSNPDFTTIAMENSNTLSKPGTLPEIEERSTRVQGTSTLSYVSGITTENPNAISEHSSTTESDTITFDTKTIEPSNSLSEQRSSTEMAVFSTSTLEKSSSIGDNTISKENAHILSEYGSSTTEENTQSQSPNSSSSSNSFTNLTSYAFGEQSQTTDASTFYDARTIVTESSSIDTESVPTLEAGTTLTEIEELSTRVQGTRMLSYVSGITIESPNAITEHSSTTEIDTISWDTKTIEPSNSVSEQRSSTEMAVFSTTSQEKSRSSVGDNTISKGNAHILSEYGSSTTKENTQSQSPNSSSSSNSFTNLTSYAFSEQSQATDASTFSDAKTIVTESSFIDTESVPTSKAGSFNLGTTDSNSPQFITGESAISAQTLDIMSESNSTSKVTELHPVTEHNTTIDSRSQTSHTSDFYFLSVSTKDASSSSHAASESKSATPVSDSGSQSLYTKHLLMTTSIDPGNYVTTSALNYHTTSEYDNTSDVTSSERIDTHSNFPTTTDERTNSGYSKATDNKMSSDASMIVTESPNTVTNYSSVHAIKTESSTSQLLNVNSEVDTTTNSIQFSSNIEGKRYATKTNIVSTLVTGIIEQTTESGVDHISSNPDITTIAIGTTNTLSKPGTLTEIEGLSTRVQGTSTLSYVSGITTESPNAITEHSLTTEVDTITWDTKTIEPSNSFREQRSSTKMAVFSTRTLETSSLAGGNTISKESAHILSEYGSSTTEENTQSQSPNSSSSSKSFTNLTSYAFGEQSQTTDASTFYDARTIVTESSSIDTESVPTLEAGTTPTEIEELSTRVQGTRMLSYVSGITIESPNAITEHSSTTEIDTISWDTKTIEPSNSVSEQRSSTEMAVFSTISQEKSRSSVGDNTISKGNAHILSEYGSSTTEENTQSQSPNSSSSSNSFTNLTSYAFSEQSQATDVSTFSDAKTIVTESSFIDTESVPTSKTGSFNLGTTDSNSPQFITGESAISTQTLDIMSESNSTSKVTELHPVTEHNTIIDSRSQTSQTSDFYFLSVSTKDASSSSHAASESKSATPVSDSGSQSLYTKHLLMTTSIDPGNYVTTSALNYDTTSEYDNTSDVTTSERIDTHSNFPTTTDERTNSGYSKATDNKMASDASMIVTESPNTVTNYSSVHAIKAESLTSQLLNVNSEVGTTTNSIQFSSNIEGKRYATKTNIVSTLVTGIIEQTTESGVDHISSNPDITTIAIGTTNTLSKPGTLTEIEGLSTRVQGTSTLSYVSGITTESPNAITEHSLTTEVDTITWDTKTIEPSNSVSEQRSSTKMAVFSTRTLETSSLAGGNTISKENAHILSEYGSSTTEENTQSQSPNSSSSSNSFTNLTSYAFSEQSQTTGASTFDDARTIVTESSFIDTESVPTSEAGTTLTEIEELSTRVQGTSTLSYVSGITTESPNAITEHSPTTEVDTISWDTKTNEPSNSVSKQRSSTEMAVYSTTSQEKSGSSTGDNTISKENAHILSEYGASTTEENTQSHSPNSSSSSNSFTNLISYAFGEQSQTTEAPTFYDARTIVTESSFIDTESVPTSEAGTTLTEIEELSTRVQATSTLSYVSGVTTESPDAITEHSPTTEVETITWDTKTNEPSNSVSEQRSSTEMAVYSTTSQEKSSSSIGDNTISNENAHILSEYGSSTTKENTQSHSPNSSSSSNSFTNLTSYAFGEQSQTTEASTFYDARTIMTESSFIDTESVPTSEAGTTLTEVEELSTRVQATRMLSYVSGITTESPNAISEHSATTEIDTISWETKTIEPSNATEASTFYDARKIVTESSFIDTESVPTSEAGSFNFGTTDKISPQFITDEPAFSSQTLDKMSVSNTASKLTELYAVTEHNTGTDSKRQTAQTSDFRPLSESTKDPPSSFHTVSESKSAIPVSDWSSQSLYTKSLLMTTSIKHGNFFTTTEIKHSSSIISIVDNTTGMTIDSYTTVTMKPDSITGKNGKSSDGGSIGVLSDTTIADHHNSNNLNTHIPFIEEKNYSTYAHSTGFVSATTLNTSKTAESILSQAQSNLTTISDGASITTEKYTTVSKRGNVTDRHTQILSNALTTNTAYFNTNNTKATMIGTSGTVVAQTSGKATRIFGSSTSVTGPFSSENTTATSKANPPLSTDISFGSLTTSSVITSGKTKQPSTKPMPPSETIPRPCPKELDSKGTYWNVTQPGSTGTASCSFMYAGHHGNITRRCTDAGSWLAPIYGCVSQEVTDIQNTISTLKASPSAEKVEAVLGQLTRLTSQEQQNESLFSGEIEVIMSSLDTIASLKLSQVSENQSMAFLETAGNLLDVRNSESWQAIDQKSPANEAVTGATRLLDVVDSFTDVIANSLDGSEQEKTIMVPNLLLQVRRISDSEPVVFPDDTSHHDFASGSTLYLSPKALQGSTRFSAVMYKNLTGILSPRAAYNSKANVLGSSVIAASLDNWRRNEDFFITIAFEHSRRQNMTSTCSFRTENSFLWDRKGCVLKSSNSTTTVCECDHLTNFAILMSPWTEETIESTTLHVLTLAGCSLSTLGLLVTVLVHFYFWRYLKSDRVKVLINLCVALIISYIIFLAGVDRTENKGVCITVAVLLQYIYLVVFFLMLAEGIELAFAVVYVFTTKSRIKWSLPSAWLIPGVIVSISVGVTRTKGYGNDHYCWLSLDNGLIWAFVGPALVILLINSVILGIVLKAIFMSQIRQQKKDKITTGVRSLCVLLPLLGCTWIIGILYVNKSVSWMQYVFAVCNASQGVVIFIFHCLLDAQVRKAYKTKQQRSEAAPVSSSNPRSKFRFLFKPRVKKHASSSSTWYPITSSTGKETSRLHEYLENEMDDHHHRIEMKRFRYIRSYYEEECTRL